MTEVISKQIMALIERVERLEEDKADKADIIEILKDVYAEARASDADRKAGQQEVEPGECLGVTRFCQRYDIARSRAYEELKAGRLKAKKVGRRTLIVNADEWLRNLPDAGLATGPASDADSHDPS